MDFSKPHAISVDFKDRGGPPHWELRLFAEIVFVDKTQSGVNPLIYQLKEHAVPSYEHLLHWGAHGLRLPQEAFTLLGTASAFDKQRKQILLTNKNTVAYQYLVIASSHKSGSSLENPQFMAAFHALVCALRLKNKIPACFFLRPSDKAKNKSPAGDAQHLHVKLPASAIELIAKPYICQISHFKTLGKHFQDIHQFLYEVCL